MELSTAMNRILIAGILIISTAPLYAQGAQPNTAKLKADAQKVVGIIKGDKAKNETFCQMVIVGKAIDEAIQEKDNKKAAELAKKITDLEKNLGPKYVALVHALTKIDLNSKEAQEIVSTFDTLDESCPH
jgi:parvulin-like peptidyl-prolyl isomerase